MTVASEKGALNHQFLERCSAIVVQTEGMRKKLIEVGVTEHRVELVYPGVDLSKFRPRADRACGRVRILFATFPRSVEELRSRGVDLLLEIAAKLPDIDFTLLARPWSRGDSALSAVKERVAEQCLKNVSILEGVQRHMGELYRSHDFTVIPFTTADGGKECPRSLVEALASGVPVLISQCAPFAEFVARHECGRVFAPDPGSFAAGVERAMCMYSDLSRNAANCSRNWFDLGSTMRAYAGIYQRALTAGT